MKIKYGGRNISPERAGDISPGQRPGYGRVYNSGAR